MLPSCRYSYFSNSINLKQNAENHLLFHQNINILWRCKLSVEIFRWIVRENIEAFVKMKINCVDISRKFLTWVRQFLNSTGILVPVTINHATTCHETCHVSAWPRHGAEVGGQLACAGCGGVVCWRGSWPTEARAASAWAWTWSLDLTRYWTQGQHQARPSHRAPARLNESFFFVHHWASVDFSILILG